MGNKKIWTLDKEGNEVLRDLAKENENFNLDRYYAGEFDGNNNFISRMNRLGFRSFVLFLGNGDLRTVNFWKE